MRSIDEQLSRVEGDVRQVELSEVLARHRRSQRRRLAVGLAIIAMPISAAYVALVTLHDPAGDSEVVSIASEPQDSDGALPKFVDVGDGVQIYGEALPASDEADLDIVVIELRPSEREFELFQATVEIGNAGANDLKIEDFGRSQILGEPPSLAVANSYCGFGSPVKTATPGLCLAVSQTTRIAPGDSIDHELYGLIDLGGMSPLKSGVYEYTMELSVARAGGDTRTIVVPIVFTVRT